MHRLCFKKWCSYLVQVIYLDLDTRDCAVESVNDRDNFFFFPSEYISLYLYTRKSALLSYRAQIRIAG